jgi:hypothetical protein
MPPFRKSLPYLLLFVTFALRTWQLTTAPPGLTHDEAGHGHDAAHILQGTTLLYFTVGYGREPLFDYLNAGLIAGIGLSPFTLRFSAVLIGMLALAATHRAARTLFGWETATAALAMMGASFWPLATSRQILRSDLLPFEMAMAVLFFLKLNSGSAKTKGWPMIGFILFIAASLYTYIPARILWLVFPLTLVTYGVWRFRNRRAALRLVFRSLVAVFAAFLLAAPLFYYLYQHPDAEQRIGMLAQPLIALQNGNPAVILANAFEFLLAFFWAGHGDHFLAYNIPGQPIFDPFSALLFLMGLLLLFFSSVIERLIPQTPEPSSFRFIHHPLARPLLFFWLVLGLAPALITGPEALTTRIIGAQPALYIIVALPLARLFHVDPKKERFYRDRGVFKPYTQVVPVRPTLVLAGAVGLSLLGAFTAYQYFVTWSQSPDVRAAYQSTLIEMLKSVKGPTVISTLYPGVAHDPYVGELLTKEETRWVDARYAVILRPENNPTGAAPFQLIAPASTPVHPYLANFFQQRLKVTLRPDDLDPYFAIFQPFSFRDAGSPAGSPTFNSALVQRAQHWLAESYKPGDVAQLFTGWQVLDPATLGPAHPPAFKSELILFTHILNSDGSIYLQQDRLDAPSWQWQAGDTVLQIHQFAIPADATPGEYQVEVGFYDHITGERLLTQDGADHLIVAPLILR